MVQRAVVASLFDRLISPETAVSASGACSRDAYIQSVVRDLELLLNSRAKAVDHPLGLLDYGIADAIGLNLLSQSDRLKLTDNIAQAIRRFEPRLEDVDVAFKGHVDGGRKLLLAIAASVLISGEVERVVFNTHYQPTGSIYKVQRG